MASGRKVGMDRDATEIATATVVKRAYAPSLFAWCSRCPKLAFA